MSRLIAYVLAFLAIVCSSARVTGAQASIGAIGILAGVCGVHVPYCRYISVFIAAFVLSGVVSSQTWAMCVAAVWVFPLYPLAASPETEYEDADYPVERYRVWCSTIPKVVFHRECEEKPDAGAMVVFVVGALLVCIF